MLSFYSQYINSLFSVSPKVEFVLQNIQVTIFFIILALESSVGKFMNCCRNLLSSFYLSFAKPYIYIRLHIYKRPKVRPKLNWTLILPLAQEALYQHGIYHVAFFRDRGREAFLCLSGKAASTLTWEVFECL